MGYIPHKVEDFHRRTLSKSTSTPKLVELITYIDGRQFTLQLSKKAQAMLFLSRPSEDGFEIEIVEEGPAPFTEATSPGDEHASLRRWQEDALGLGAGGVGNEVHRRGYTIEGDALNHAKRIESVVRVDGSVYLHMQAREPGMMGFVAHAAGFDIHVVGPKAAKYRDQRGPDMTSHPLYPWQIDALELIDG